MTMMIGKGVSERIKNLLAEFGIQENAQVRFSQSDPATAGIDLDCSVPSPATQFSPTILVDTGTKNRHQFHYDPEINELRVEVKQGTTLEQFRDLRHILHAIQHHDGLISSLGKVRNQLSGLSIERLSKKGIEYFIGYLNNAHGNAALEKYEMFRTVRRTLFTKFAREPYWTISYTIWRSHMSGERININQLRESVDIPQSTISRKVDDLVESGRILRERDQYDRRIVWVCPSPVEALRFSILMAAVEDGYS